MANDMTATGTLYKKSDAQQVSDKFRKRDFIITTDGQYPQYLQFQLTQDKLSLIDNVNLGDSLTVSFNLRGRLWTNPEGKESCFNTLDAWKIDHVGTAQGGAQPLAQQVQNAVDGLQGGDDLPF